MKKTKNKEKRELSVLIAGFFLLFLANQTAAMLNPEAVYCNAMGYQYVIKTLPEGEAGYCKLPDGTECKESDFIKNICGGNYSYCSKQGLGYRTGKGVECNSTIKDMECGVCVMGGGEVVEITRLMNLSFDEGVCGDGVCVIGESPENCPQDCGGETTTTITVTTTRLVTTTIEAATTTAPVEVTTTTTQPVKEDGGFMSFVPVIVVLIVIVVVAVFGFKYYRKMQDAKIERQRQDFLKWREEQEKLEKKI